MRREGHSVLVCPICIKKDRGRGAVQSYYHPFEIYSLYCVFCGWKGTYETVQTYKFPCVIYRTVEIDLSVLKNMVTTISSTKGKIVLPMFTSYGEILTYEASGGQYDAPNWGKCEWIHIDDALNWLVNGGWLFPAIYKVYVNV
jgi:hypothetical protein